MALVSSFASVSPADSVRLVGTIVSVAWRDVKILTSQISFGILCCSLYNVYYRPHRSFPGPKLASGSGLIFLTVSLY
jgi:hypothetical protein